MAQWIRRLPTEQEIPGSSPGMGYFFNSATFGEQKLKKNFPRSRSRTSDLEISIASSYSLPLYQLSYTRISKKKVLPGLEPGLQGSKPWVLTNYTIEPNLLQKNLKIEKMTRHGIRTEKNYPRSRSQLGSTN